MRPQLASQFEQNTRLIVHVAERNEHRGVLLFWVNGYGSITVISDQRGPYRRERLSGKRYVWMRKYAGRSVGKSRGERPEHLCETLKQADHVHSCLACIPLITSCA